MRKSSLFVWEGGFDPTLSNDFFIILLAQDFITWLYEKVVFVVILKLKLLFF